MRVDRLLYFLRFARSRSRAAELVASGHLRRNGERIARGSLIVHEGDVLTLPLGQQVALIEILSLPGRRGSPRDAQLCYRRLDQSDGEMVDPSEESAIAAAQTNRARGPARP